MNKGKCLSVMLLVLFLMVPLLMLAQGNKITLKLNQTPLSSALQQVERQSDYYKISYSTNELSAYKVTADIVDMEAPAAVNHLIQGLPLNATVKGRFITVKADGSRKETPARDESASIISGTVLDADGEPLPGVAVKDKSGRINLVTDAYGCFSFKSDHPATLRFSFVGMNDAEVKANPGKQVSVVMSSQTNELNDVVVTGYQVVDKRASTSAITSIKAEDVIRPDAISIDQMLEGKIPDMIFMSNSGETGVAPKIRIRGTSSIIGNREPLWVVDGIVVTDPVNISPEDLNDPDYVNRIGNAIAGLNPQDIERLDVLKDASATALYGTKAANGVIVVTTKRGTEGAPTIRYNNSFTWKLRPRYTDRSVDVMNSQERIAMSRELFQSHYVYPQNSSLIGFEGLLNDFYAGKINNAQFNEQMKYYEQINTDWFDLLTHNSFSQQHTLSLSGGGQRGTYYASLGFTDNDDVVKGTTNRRYNAMINLDVNFSKVLTASFGIQGNISNRDYYQSSLSPVDYAYSTSRAIPAYNGDQYAYYPKTSMWTEPHNFNILNELENSGISQEGSSVTFNANLRFKFTDWLSANAIFSYTHATTNIENLWGDKTWYASELRNSEPGVAAPSDSYMPQGSQLTVDNNKAKSWTARLQLDWNKYFNDELHNFSGGIGVEANQNKYEGYYNITRGYFPDRGMSFVQGIDLDMYPNYKSWLADNTPTLTNNKSNTMSAYLTLSYNYDRMFFFNINGRVDGSNNFGDASNDKFLPIWSVSGSFDAKRLSCLRDLTWLDYFSIKASLGYQGNMLSSESPVMIIRKEPFDNFYNEFTATVQHNPNPNLKWEKTTSYNIGFEWGFFNRRLELDADIYWKRTKDAFMTKTISTINGYSSYVVNGGDIDNDGYSIAITGRILDSRDWQWSITTNFSRTINRIRTNPDGESYELSDFLNGTAIVKGKSVGTFYSYKFIGLSPVDGHPMFDDWFDHYQDLQSMSKYDTYTSVLTASGSREPFMQGALGTSLRWKDLRFTANFAYSLGAKTRLFGMYGAGGTSTIGNATISNAGEIRPEQNLSRDYIDRWKKPGDEKHTNIPAIISKMDPNYLTYIDHWSNGGQMAADGIQSIADSYWDMYDYSDYRVASADYLKLSSVSLSYTLPKQWLTGWGVKRLEVTATGTNLFTICDSKLKGQTPTQGGFTTIQLSDRPGFSFGLNVTF